MRVILFFVFAVILTGCQATSQSVGKKVTIGTKAHAHAGRKSKRCRVTNLNWKRSHPRLKNGLCRMSRDLGPVHVVASNKRHKNCRTRGTNRSVKGSYHLYNRGCKAADVRIAGVSNRRIRAWWKRNVGGGTGSYGCSGFAHVDTGPRRSWYWKCKKRRG